VGGRPLNEVLDTKFKMRGNEIQERVYDWLAEHYPEGPEWDRPGFHCFRDCPLPIRMIPAIDSLEAEVSNGAWGQLLWNTLPNWRALLQTAVDGYELIGALEHAAAARDLQAKLAEHEAACSKAQATVTDEDSFSRAFGKFTSEGYADVEFAAQMTIASSDSDSIRLGWLEANQATVLRDIGV
jgi:hypothetical protein